MRQRVVEHHEKNERVQRLRIDDRLKLVLLDGRAVRLSGKEFALLSLLASDPGRVFSYEEILEEVWTDSERASRSDVRQVIYLLRRHVERDPQAPLRVCTAAGFGYYLAAEESVREG